jgi:hypothetical protein
MNRSYLWLLCFVLPISALADMPAPPALPAVPALPALPATPIAPIAPDIAPLTAPPLPPAVAPYPVIPAPSALPAAPAPPAPPAPPATPHSPLTPTPPTPATPATPETPTPHSSIRTWYSFFEGKSEKNATATEVADTQFFDLWKNAYPKLVETLHLKDNHADLPDSAWFGRDKKQNVRDINALLQKSLDMFAFSGIQANIEEIEKTRKKITQLRADINDQQTRAVGDPDNAEKYNTRIANLKAAIQLQENTIEQTKNQILAQLLALGLNVTREQVDILLAGVSGTDIVQMSVVFNNVKLFSTELARLMAENREDLAFARRHYGMYTILIELLVLMQQHFIDDVEQIYVPGIVTRNAKFTQF